MIGYRVNNGRTVMTERGLCEYMIGPHVKAVRVLTIVACLVWVVAAIVSLHAESPDRGEFPPSGWIALVFSVLFIAGTFFTTFQDAVPAAKPFFLTLSAVTGKDIYSYYDEDTRMAYPRLLFFDNDVPRQTETRVSQAEYSSAGKGDLYYLLIAENRIVGCFSAALYEPDAELEKTLVDETKTPERKRAAAEEEARLEADKRCVEAALIDAVPGAQQRKDHASIAKALASFKSVDDHGLDASSGAVQRSADFPRKLLVLWLAASMLTCAVQLACLFLFLPEAAHALWPAALLPLLAGMRPLHLLSSQKRAGESGADPVYYVTEQTFINEGFFRKLNPSVACMCVFLALFWAVFCWIRAEDDPDLWGPMLVFLLIPLIISAVFFLTALGRRRARRSILQNDRLHILRLPLLRRDELVFRVFHFPFITPDPALSFTGTKAYADGRVMVSVSEEEYAHGREGDHYYLLVQSILPQGIINRRTKFDLLWVIPENQCVMNNGMAGLLTDLPSLAPLVEDPHPDPEPRVSDE